MTYEQLERCYKTVMKHRDEAEVKVIELTCIIEELNEECENLAKAWEDGCKAYSKQHDCYRDIFISLVKVERENKELKEKLSLAT